MSAEENLLLYDAKKVISRNYSKKTHSASCSNGVIDWLIQNAANPAIVSYRGKFGNTVLHSLVSDLPFLKGDSNLEQLLRYKPLERTLKNLVNVKDKEGKIPLDIALEILFSEEDPKCMDGLNSSNVSISLKYINYLILHNSDKQILKKDDILLGMAKMCKTDHEVNIFKNILKNLGDKFRNNYVNYKNLGTALDLNATNNQEAVVYFVNWLLEAYTSKLKKECANLEIYEEILKGLYNIIPETNIQARDSLNNVRCDVRGEMAKNDNFSNFVSDNNNVCNENSNKKIEPRKNYSNIPREHSTRMVNMENTGMPIGPGLR